MTEATDTTDDKELTLDSALLLARYATGIAEALLSVAVQCGADPDSMTMEVNGDGAELSVPHAIEYFKLRLGMESKSTAEKREEA